MNRKQFIGLTLAVLVSIMSLGTLSRGAAWGQTSIDQVTFRNIMLSKHNTYRATHHSPPMTLSDSLNSSAESWAKQMATTGEFAHTSISQRKGAGENIYASYTLDTIAASMTTDTLANSAVKGWYDEVSNYNYANPPGPVSNSQPTGHISRFSQVVWKSSTQLGCGAAYGIRNNSLGFKAFYVVCHYAPIGNIIGRFPANVLKP